MHSPIGQPICVFASPLPAIVNEHWLFVDFSVYFDSCEVNFPRPECLRTKLHSIYLCMHKIFCLAEVMFDLHVLVIHPSVNGTPTKLSLNVRFSNELAKFSTASSRGSSDLILSFRIGSSIHLLNCSYTSSNSELKSVESSRLHFDFWSAVIFAYVSVFKWLFTNNVPAIQMNENAFFSIALSAANAHTFTICKFVSKFVQPILFLVQWLQKIFAV